jgi:hypothetical protein
VASAKYLLDLFQQIFCFCLPRPADGLFDGLLEKRLRTQIGSLPFKEGLNLRKLFVLILRFFLKKLVLIIWNSMQNWPLKLSQKFTIKINYPLGRILLNKLKFELLLNFFKKNYFRKSLNGQKIRLISKMGKIYVM